MNEEAHKIDDLLRRNVRRQLETFDWDQLNARLSDRLDRIGHQRLSPKRQWSPMATAAIILLAVVSGGVIWQWRARPSHPSVLQQIMAGVLDAGPLGDPVSKADNLVVSTDPGTILLTQHVHLISGDPLLRPHSLWDQMPVSAGRTEKERPR